MLLKAIWQKRTEQLGEALAVAAGGAEHQYRVLGQHLTHQTADAVLVTCTLRGAVLRKTASGREQKNKLGSYLARSLMWLIARPGLINDQDGGFLSEVMLTRKLSSQNL